MRRREFLQAAAITSAGVTCNTHAARAGSSAVREAGVYDDSPVVEATISQLLAGLQAGRWSATELVQWYLQRIEAIDRNGPKLNAVLEINPEALDVAQRLDAERKRGRLRGALHGIPILIKDNIDTADKMTTTAGSLALEGWHPPNDSGVAARLRQAGAVILGKTNLSEWANFRSNHSSSGWSGRGGQTRNPYVTNRNPCGSSSGSGVAAAASLCAAAIGTETNGSIVCPSSINGVVGIKPTVGQVSRAGIIPISHTQDTAGPMARTVADAALLLAAISGADPRDAATQHDHPFFSARDIRLDADGLQGKRIGVARDYFGFDDRVDELAESAIKVLADRGATLVDPVKLRIRGAGQAAFDLLLYEFKADLNAYLKHVAPELPVHSLQELIEFNRKHADREMPFFGQELFELAQAKGTLEDDAYRKAVAAVRKAYREDGIDKLVKEHRLDAIVAPTTGPSWVTDLVYGDRGSGGSSSPAARAGYPNVTVPMGYIAGLPVGLSFIGSAFSEPKLVTIAYAFEQASAARKRPRFAEEVTSPTAP